jgi:hypothetical protein
MTDYEAQSLAVAKHQLSAYWGADGIALLALIAAIVGGVLAYRNLKVMRWGMLLSLEQDMATRRGKFLDIAAQMEAHPGASDLQQAQFNEAKENYFNSLDRLASSILNGHFPDSEMKHDYLESFTTVVREYKDDFGPGTHYRKTIKLYEKWQNQR